MTRRTAGTGPRMAGALCALVLLSVLPSDRDGAAAAQERLTQDEALRLAFPPPARLERRTAFLDSADLAAVRRAAGEDAATSQRVVTYYLARRDGRPLGVAYFDGHRVRSLQEVLMVVVTPDGRIQRLEVLRFDEPPEYRPPEGWLRQFRGKALDDDLSLRGGIVRMTGATLTSQAVTRAARRVLALHRVIRPFEQAPTGSAGTTR
ncbi:MAG TPA: FMN-binding protein [Gemmatimonadales bacterium]|nr:FMN-binding protein [Gemmatimonadales bacterium]